MTKLDFTKKKMNVRMFLVSLALIIGWCAMSSVTTYAQDVYVGGRDNNKATVWKNGTPEYLAEYGVINSIVVVEDNVYAAGIESILGIWVAKVWKNSEELYVLTDGTDDAETFSIVVSSNDVYVVGYDGASGERVGKVWKNGVAQTGYTEAAELHSIFVNGSDIYVAGITNTNSVIVWKNGAVLYTLALEGYAAGVFVANGDVYTAGADSVSKIWKNDEILYTFEPEADISDLYISNGVVYTAGDRNFMEQVAKLWIDGVGTELTEGTWASSVFVSDNDVYVSGMENLQKALLWVNGVATTLATSVGSTYSYAMSVFVVPEGAGIASISNDELRIYPNPTGDILNFSFETSFEIINLQGKTLLKSDIAVKSVNINSLPSGVYFVKRTTETGSSVTKIIKE